MELDLLPGESRGYWKYHSPGKWFKQAKAMAKINYEKAMLLIDSSAEVSIVDSTFARKVGFVIDESQRQECVGIGESAYMTEGRTKIKITLAGSLVYYFDVWVGALSGQVAILVMDFMVPAGIRLDLSHGSLCLPDEVRIQLAGRRQLYSAISRFFELGQYLEVPVSGSVEIAVPSYASDRQKLWITRGERWVPTFVKGLGRSRYLRITNVSDQSLTLQRDARLGIWLTGEHVPRSPGYISIGSRRYAEWQNLAYQATTDQKSEEDSGDEVAEPLVDRPQYDLPTRIMVRKVDQPKPAVAQVTTSRQEPSEVKPEAEVETPITEGPIPVKSEEPEHPVDHAEGTSKPAGLAEESPEQEPLKVEAEAETEMPIEEELTPVKSDEPVEQADQTEEILGAADQAEEAPKVELPTKSDGAEAATQEEDQVCYHEGGDLFVEDVEKQMAVLPEVSSTTDEVTIEDIQVGDPELNTPEEIDCLRRIIWKRCHLLIGKGNALPPAALGAVCDIDVGDAKPVAQRCCRVAPQFREKLSALIKGLLSATIISPSTSPWASPIVVIIKKNGVDIRLCIDYRVVNGLTRLMIYPMPLINDLLEDLDKVLWFCSLDMASVFWVVSITKRARKISAFITLFGLFEWNRMPFGLKNAPQIYQRLIGNALYGHLRISADADTTEPIDVFKDGEPEPDQKPSVLGRRSYIDDILVTAPSWDVLCEKVESYWVPVNVGTCQSELRRVSGVNTRWRTYVTACQPKV